MTKPKPPVVQLGGALEKRYGISSTDAPQIAQRAVQLFKKLFADGAVLYSAHIHKKGSSEQLLFKTDQLLSVRASRIGQLLPGDSSTKLDSMIKSAARRIRNGAHLMFVHMDKNGNPTKANVLDFWKIDDNK